MSGAVKGALAGACATSLLMLVVLSPGATGQGDSPRLKLTTVLAQNTVPPAGFAGEPYVGKTVTARCPKGYRVVGGGAIPNGGTLDDFGRLTKRQFRASVTNDGRHSDLSLTIFAQAICAKGAGGLIIDDDGSGFATQLAG